MTTEPNPTTPAQREAPPVELQNDRAIVAEVVETLSFNTADLFADQKGTIFENARTPTGRRAFELTEDTIIDVDLYGSGRTREVSIRDALRYGLVRRDEAGNFVEVTREEHEAAAAQRAEAEKAARDAEFADLPAWSREGTAAANEVYGFIHDTGLDVSSACVSSLTSGFVPKAVTEAWVASGRNLNDLKAKVQRVYAEYYGRAASVLKANGVRDPAHFWQWFEQVDKGAARSAQIQFLHEDHRALKAAAKRYRAESRDYSGHGFESKVDAQGSEWIILENGKRMLARQARQLGII
ncbi:MAG: hypothetical protein HC900_03395 [Methylacidiphilales bacterium]|nr:hypothetical protein [Candidatus Methylacidiphilales bacterium]